MSPSAKFIYLRWASRQSSLTHQIRNKKAWLYANETSHDHFLTIHGKRISKNNMGVAYQQVGFIKVKKLARTTSHLINLPSLYQTITRESRDEDILTSAGTSQFSICGYVSAQYEVDNSCRRRILQ